MPRKDHGYHVENTPMAPNNKMILPTAADYTRQAIVYSIVGTTLLAGSFVTLPAAFAPAWPILVRLALSFGVLACAASCFMGAKGFPLQHPLYVVLTAVQSFTSLGLTIWFVFGDNQLTVPWKVLAAVIFGFTAFILLLPVVVSIAFPGLMNQAMNEAQLESKKNRHLGKRD